jgi:hypothetical protein
MEEISESEEGEPRCPMCRLPFQAGQVEAIEKVQRSVCPQRHFGPKFWSG